MPSRRTGPLHSRRRRTVLLGGLLALGVQLLVLLGPAGPAILRLERVLALRLAGAPAPPPEQAAVVIVDVEQWPRELSSLAQALLRIRRRKPRVVALDIFADADSGLGQALTRGEFFADLLRSSDYPVLLATQLLWSWDATASAFVADQIQRPVEAVSGPHLGMAALGAPRPMEDDAPILAVRQTFRDQQGGQWLGLGLTAALLHGFTPLVEGTWPSGVTSARVALGSQEIVLDDGRLWMARVPTRQDFVTIPLSALAGATVDPELLARIDGRVVLFGLVGSTSSLDTHRTATGWTRGVLLHAGQIQQLIEGRSYLPISAMTSAGIASVFLLLAALLTVWLGCPWRAGVCALVLGLLGAAGSLLCLRLSWTLAPPLRPLAGALLGYLGIVGAWTWSMHVELQSFRNLPARKWSVEPLAELFRRGHIQRLLANELVRSRSWTSSADPAFVEQDKEQRVFRQADRVERRIAAMEWELGTPRGVKDVVEILYLSLYEGSGALKRIPVELKGASSPIFVLKHLRNFFDHSYELTANVRRSLDEALASWAGACLADLQGGNAELLQRVQVRLLEKGNAWLQALQDRLRRELRSIQIVAPRQTWLSPQPRFVWLWEGQARAWHVSVCRPSGQTVLEQRLDGERRSWSAPPEVQLAPGTYTAQVRLELASPARGPTVSSSFRIPEPTSPLVELLPGARGPAEGPPPELETVAELRAWIESAEPEERGFRFLVAGVTSSEAAASLFPLAESSQRASQGLAEALKALEVPEDLVVRVLLRGVRASSRPPGAG